MSWLEGLYQKISGEGTAVNLTSIYANVEESQTTLNQIKAQAEIIRNQKTALQQLSADTETCWKGVSADCLREKLETIISEQESIAADLEQNVQEMLRTIQQLVDADTALAYAIQNADSSSGINSGGSGRRG